MDINVMEIKYMHITQPPRDSLLSLNDDCLLAICSLLSFRDKIEFAFVCQRFRSISNEVLKRNKFLNLNDFQSASLKTVRRILSIIGHHKTHIQLSFSERFIHLFPEFFPNVEYIEFKSLTNIQSKHFKNMKYMFKKLKALSITGSYLTDNMCLYLKKCHNLEKLNLSENLNMTGLHLDKLRNLQDLNISSTNFNQNNFVLLCKTATKIRSLNIYGCRNLIQPAIDALTQNAAYIDTLCIHDAQCSYFRIELFEKLKILKIIKWLGKITPLTLSVYFFEGIMQINLEELIIDGVYINSPEHFSRMRSIRTLLLRNCYYINDDFVIQIASVDFNLKHFECSNSMVTEVSILYLISKVIDIEIIDLFGCTNITDSLIFHAVELLKQIKRHYPLRLNVCRTGIRTSILKDDMILKNSHLLVVVHD